MTVSALPPSFLQPIALIEAAYMHGIFSRRSLHCFLFACRQVPDKADDEIPEEQGCLRLERAVRARISGSIVEREESSSPVEQRRGTIAWLAS